MTEQTACDLCSAQSFVQWVWHLENTVATAEEAIEQQVPFADQLDWLVCDTCHRMVLNERRDQLIMRALMFVGDKLYLSFNSDEAVADKFDMEQYVSQIHQGFWALKSTHTSLEDHHAGAPRVLPVRRDD